MFPELFSFEIPESLRIVLGFLPESATIQSYGTLIGIGVILGLIYTTFQAGKIGVEPDKIANLFLLVFIAAYVGGRFFYFFEKPDHFFGTPANMLKFSGSGFVFYGSLLIAIPAMLYFFRKNKMPVLYMLDIMAFVAVFVHGFGRLGCFAAGCCYGLPTNSFLGVTFTDPVCQANPLGVPLHPTQLYDFALIAVIGITLYFLKKRKQFDGQLFIIYILLYAAGRAVVEIFRGDEIRGFVLNGYLSHSQLISIVIIIVGLYFYQRLKKNKQILKPSPMVKDKK